MTGQWSDRSAIRSNELFAWPGIEDLDLIWRKESSTGMDMWNAPRVQSRQPVTYRLMESSWQRGIAEIALSYRCEICHAAASQLPGRGPLMRMLPLYLHVNQKSDDDDDDDGSSWLSTHMIDTPGDLVWALLCMQQASYLEGGPLMWMLPLYLHNNKQIQWCWWRWWKLLAMDPHVRQPWRSGLRSAMRVQQASYLEGGPLMWISPLYLHINQKSDADDDDGPYWCKFTMLDLPHTVSQYFSWPKTLPFS